MIRKYLKMGKCNCLEMSKKEEYSGVVEAYSVFLVLVNSSSPLHSSLFSKAVKFYEEERRKGKKQDIPSFNKYFNINLRIIL